MHVLKKDNQKIYYPTGKLLKLAVSATSALSRAALSIPTDIVHVCKPHPMNSFVGMVAKLLRRKQLCLDCDDFEAASGHFTSTWQQASVAWFERQMPRQACIVTTNTLFMRQKLIEWGIPSEKVIYIPNGVDRKRFQPPGTDQVEALRAKLGIEGKRVVAYIGSLGLASHPVDLLIEAFPRVHQALPDSVLLLVGGGEDYDQLKRQSQRLGIENIVRFCGRVSPDQIPAYYNIAHVSVDPVHADDAARGRCPLKLFESWACGVPFVTGDVGDRGLLLGDPPAGILAQPGDSIALSQAIIKVLSDPNQAATMAHLGLERVKAYYWDFLVRDLEAAYSIIA
jgi:glycosyltransferase involved in cell wall biosynthesis